VTNPQTSQKNKSFSVAPSPFNSIKLELAIVMVVGGLMLAAVDSITQDLILQISILLIAGLLGMAWIIWRTRKQLKRHGKTTSNSHHSAESEY